MMCAELGNGSGIESSTGEGPLATDVVGHRFELIGRLQPFLPIPERLDNAVFIDEERLGNSAETRGVIGIDQCRKGDAELIVIQLGRRDSLGIEGDADHGEAQLTVSLECLLPPGQVVSAESPAGPAVDDILLAEEF